jgi:hypothetical protein
MDNTMGNDKILDYGTDIKIESEKMTVEYFVWDCPNCGRHNRTLEFNVSNYLLWCIDCHKETKYTTTNFHNAIKNNPKNEHN